MTSRGRPARRRVWLAGAASLMSMLAVAGCTSASAPAAPAASTPPPAPAAGSTSSAPAAQDADWPAYGRTAARSGVSVSSPAPGQVRRAWMAAVDGAVYAQPLIVGSEVIVATENNTVYALDASTGAVRWSRHLASPVPSGLPCGNVDPSGITGTPVADVAAGRLWAVTFTSAPAYRHTLWSLSLATGTTVSQRPVDVSGSDPRAQQQRGALTLLGSRVYVPFGGLYGDCSDYKGRVVGAPTSGSGPLVSFTTANDRQAGIWAPAGESVRGNSLYVATGNGMPVDQVDDSDSVLRLSPSLQAEDRFTPSNFQALSAGDQDLGSTAPALLPDGLVFQVGKQGIGYVLNGTRLGGTGGELTSATVCEGGFGGDAVDGSTVVFSCYRSLHAVQVTPGANGAAPRLRVLWTASGTNPGPPIIAGGVVWDISGKGGLAGYRLSDGRSVFTAQTSSPETSFPSPAASGTRLVVPEGDQVASYAGI